MTVEKWERMQDRRVRVDILFTTSPETASTLQGYARQMERIIKDAFVDVIVQHSSAQSPSGQADLFRVLVDERAVVVKRAEATGVAVKMAVLESAIVSARRRRRPPSTVYSASPSEVVDEGATASEAAGAEAGAVPCVKEEGEGPVDETRGPVPGRGDVTPGRLQRAERASRSR